MNLLLHSTPTALWHSIIHNAEETCSVFLKEELEAYLVFLLSRYTTKPEFVNQLIAHEFLRAMASTPAERNQALKDVGDKCLLFAGLFPSIAEKRLVKLSYFVKLGQAAYIGMSAKENDLYESLAEQFVSMMDILQSIRYHSKEHAELLPLQAYEVWSETGSQRALSILKQYTSSIPFILDNHDIRFTKK